MPHIEVSTRVNRNADALWREVGSFQGVGAWHPWLAKVEGTGEAPEAIRTAETANGERQIERLQDSNPQQHWYRYVLLSTPLPVKDYVGTFRVLACDAATSIVCWSSDFRIISGNEDEVIDAIHKFLEVGLQNLKRKYA